MPTSTTSVHTTRVKSRREIEEKNASQPGVAVVVVQYQIEIGTSSRRRFKADKAPIQGKGGGKKKIKLTDVDTNFSRGCAIFRSNRSACVIIKLYTSYSVYPRSPDRLSIFFRFVPLIAIEWWFFGSTSAPIGEK